MKKLAKNSKYTSIPVKKKKKDEPVLKFRISFIFLFAFASFLACFALYMRTDVDINDLEPISITQTATAATVATIEETEDIEEEAVEATVAAVSTADINPIALCDDVGDEYLTNCVFVGDIHVSGLNAYNSEENPFTIIPCLGDGIVTLNSGYIDYDDGTSVRVIDEVNSSSASNVYIIVSLDSTSGYNDEELLSAYDEFVANIDSSKNVYVVSILPVSAEKETADDSILNSDIDSFNASLLKLANNRGVYYIDVNTDLKGTDGRLSTSYVNDDDDIMLNTAGYNKLIDYIKTHVYLGE